MAPQIHTYHCICSSLLLASTHVLSALPRRSSSSSSSSTTNSSELILPLPTTPPSLEDQSLPPAGYTLVLGLDVDKKSTIIRREDGFEKRLLYKCSRCRVVVGYELVVGNGGLGGEMMEGVVGGKGKGREVTEEGYDGKVVYLLPGGIQSTEAMMGKKEIREEDVGMKGVAVLE